MYSPQPAPSSHKIVLFGDQLENSLPAVQDLYRRAPSSLYLRHFLRAATDAARASLAGLPSSQPPKAPFFFDSFLTLAEDATAASSNNKKQGGSSGSSSVVQTLLSCVAQLGHLVLYEPSHLPSSPRSWQNVLLTMRG